VATELGTWIDRLTGPLAPRWTLRRQRARLAAELLARHYEAAAGGRRTQGWRRPSSDANAASAGALGPTRNAARDVVRNNPYAESALTTIVDHVIGWGIMGAPPKGASAAASKRWAAWAETTACDAEGRHDFAGLQKRAMRTIIESGEVLVRRRIRRIEDGLPIPLQIQILEPDYLDVAHDGPTPNGGVVVSGVEFSPIGARAAYWLFRQHPGASVPGASGSLVSDRIPASEILHVFHGGRPGQVRGVSWFAPILLRLKDLDEYEDATLMKQKVAACLAIVMTDADGSAPAIGRGTDPSDSIDTLEPGSILNAPAGRTVTVVEPPAVAEHDAFCKTALRAIAAGMGLTYEDLTGDYQNLPFSAARMSRIRHWARVEDWRWQTIIPGFCDPVWRWAMLAAAVIDVAVQPDTAVEWTAPAMPMIEPDKEGLAYLRNIRAGIQTLSEAIRERGYIPEQMLAEMQRDNALLDRLGLILDSDARKMSQAGVRISNDVPTQNERVTAAVALVQAGFDPAESLKVVGLPPIPYEAPAPAAAATPADPALVAAGSANGNGSGTG
jgi:lambda family phage portal protein